ncbi:MAG: endonuclease/exonuclease/phosphatase family protein [Pseudomonadota bacterium]|nr:endonuclease/exonuclease/phosphatase family protein [Pseudomonadota bacterium]
MRIASYNVENLFMRAKALNQDSWAEGKPVLEAHARLNALFEKKTYTAADKKKILAEMKALGIEKTDEGKFVILRKTRGSLVKRPNGKPVEVVASGRDDWIGWLELKDETVNEIAIRNTARVIADVKADILAVVEAEDRIALCRFNEDVLKPLSFAYQSIMLIDGNDSRGIDVGLMTRGGTRIGQMRSHVEDEDNKGVVFSRDCPEYQVTTPSGENILLLINHLKSKGFGSQASSNEKRLRQAKQARKIYEARRAEGVKNIVVLGDFNDTPDSAPLAPLLKQGSDLKDASEFSGFDDGGRPGTFGNGTKTQKIDFLLLSPALFSKVTAAGIFRKGVWGGKNGTLWPVYDTMEGPHHAASDHAAIWADIGI